MKTLELRVGTSVAGLLQKLVRLHRSKDEIRSLPEEAPISDEWFAINEALQQRQLELRAESLAKGGDQVVIVSGSRLLRLVTKQAAAAGTYPDDYIRICIHEHRERVRAEVESA